MGKRIRITALLVGIALLVATAHAADHEELYRFEGDSPPDSLGSSVSGAGDVNKDGDDDVIIGAVSDSSSGDKSSGSAQVISGRTR